MARLVINELLEFGMDHPLIKTELEVSRTGDWDNEDDMLLRYTKTEGDLRNLHFEIRNHAPGQPLGSGDLYDGYPGSISRVRLTFGPPYTEEDDLVEDASNTTVSDWFYPNSCYSDGHFNNDGLGDDITRFKQYGFIYEFPLELAKSHT